MEYWSKKKKKILCCLRKGNQKNLKMMINVHTMHIIPSYNGDKMKNKTDNTNERNSIASYGKTISIILLLM